MIKPDITVTSKQLSEVLDLSVRRIQQLAKSGTLPEQEARNRYRLVDSNTRLHKIPKRSGGSW